MTPTAFPSLLGVFAHPDDESLLAGGVLAQHAVTGARTSIVTTTWSPNSPRAAELASACAILGAGKPHMLGYADARNEASSPGRRRFVDAPLDEVIAQLVERVRAFRPEIVITHDALGQLTAHPDHRHTHRATLLAVEAAALAHLYPETGAPWQPRAVYAATHPASGVADLGPLLTQVGKTVMTVPDEYVTATVDVTERLNEKWQAIRSHQSQLQSPRSLPALLSTLAKEPRDRILSTEYYTRISFTHPGDGLRQQLDGHP